MYVKVILLCHYIVSIKPMKAFVNRKRGIPFIKRKKLYKLFDVLLSESIEKYHVCGIIGMECIVTTFNVMR